MKNLWLYITGGIILLLVIFRKPVTKTAIAVASKLTRGLRNNNPGNIRLTPGSVWVGEVAGNDKAFKTFVDMPHGYRAIFVTLNGYLKKGFNTIEKIISRYAPPSDNNHTDAYIATVEKRTGIPRGLILTAANREHLKKIVTAISYVENGIAADPVQVNDGFNLYYNG